MIGSGYIDSILCSSASGLSGALVVTTLSNVVVAERWTLESFKGIVDMVFLSFLCSIVVTDNRTTR